MMQTLQMLWRRSGDSGYRERAEALLARFAASIDAAPSAYAYLLAAIENLRRGELEAALQAAEAINLPDFPWDPAVRASILARLGRREEARVALGELLALDPDFRRHARRYLSGYILHDEVVDRVVGGLERAGLNAA